MGEQGGGGSRGLLGECSTSLVGQGGIGHAFKVEALMQQALEAVDLLDNALALEKVRAWGGGGGAGGC